VAESLFREEALDYVARQRGPGELVRFTSRWTEPAFWLLIVLVVAGFASTLIVQINGEPLLFILVPPLKNLHG
jgi:hypothetical protein